MPNAEPEVIDDVVEEPQLESTESTEVEAEDQGEAEEARIPLKQLVDQRKKKQQALLEIEGLKRENESLRQQNNLQSLVIPQAVDDEPEAELIPPNAYDYNDDGEWLEAQRKYNAEYKERLKADTEALVKQQLAERDKVAEQSKAEREAQIKAEEIRNQYLERADKLEAPDFLEKEDALRKEVAPWFFDQLMANFENSEQLIYQLGGDIPKAIELVEAFDKDNFRGGMELVKYAANLGKQTTDQLPEPDAAITGGSGMAVDIDSQIDKLRDQKIAGKITQNQLLQKKRELMERLK